MEELRRIEGMEHNKSVMEHRMESWTNRMRDLDRAEMRTHMQRQMCLMQQRMRADMATGMAELRDCKGMMKIVSTQVTVSSGFDPESASTKRYLATSASSVQMRVYSVDSSIDYTCPYCIETFARFSEVSIDLEEHGDEQEQVTGGDEQE
jgi:hypothetical protein